MDPDHLKDEKVAKKIGIKVPDQGWFQQSSPGEILMSTELIHSRR